MSDLATQWSEALRAGELPPGPPWLESLRERAAERFLEAGLPHRKVEDWKYTPLRRLEHMAPRIGLELQSEAEFPPPLTGADATIDIANGVLAEGLPKAPAGVRLLPLAAGLEALADRLRAMIEGTDIAGPSRAFAALNTALAGDGLVVHVAGDADAGTLLLRWAFDARDTAALANSRVFVLLEPGARLRLVEQFQSAAAAAGALNVLLQAELGEGARFEHLRVQNETDEAVVLTSTTATQSANSRYMYAGFDLGAGLVRHELGVRFEGEDASARLDGAFVLDGNRQADNHVAVDHAAPGCSSEQFFRGVAGGASRGVFNGRALIREGADGSSVRQSNANLLLSGQAEIDTKPELEIYADEVEASHGATVGQLDDVAVFYLRSRGIPEQEARRMLTSAFCYAVTDRLEDRELAETITAMIDTAMPAQT